MFVLEKILFLGKQIAMFNFLEKIQETQKVFKEKMESLEINSESGGGAIKIKINGNKKILNITIDEALLKENDKEALEELILVAVNKAIEEAEVVSAKEIQGMAKEMMPGFPGLF